MGFNMKPKSPLTKKLVGGQHRLPEGLKAKIIASPAKDYSVEKGSHGHPHSPAKHKPWAEEHKARPSHPNKAEAHNASGNPPGKKMPKAGSPAKQKESLVKVKPVKIKRMPVSKDAIQAEKDKKSYDKGELMTYGGRPKSYTKKEDEKQLEKENQPSKATPMKKRGLWDNIHAKRKRGEKMRKKGEKGAPTEKAIKESQSPAKNYKKGYYGV
jgi:hypothetical protein